MGWLAGLMYGHVSRSPECWKLLTTVWTTRVLGKQPQRQASARWRWHQHSCPRTACHSCGNMRWVVDKIQTRLNKRQAETETETERGEHLSSKADSPTVVCRLDRPGEGVYPDVCIYTSRSAGMHASAHDAMYGQSDIDGHRVLLGERQNLMAYNSRVDIVAIWRRPLQRAERHST